MPSLYPLVPLCPETSTVFYFVAEISIVTEVFYTSCSPFPLRGIHHLSFQLSNLREFCPFNNSLPLLSLPIFLHVCTRLNNNIVSYCSFNISNWTIETFKIFRMYASSALQVNSKAKKATFCASKTQGAGSLYDIPTESRIPSCHLSIVAILRTELCEVLTSG